MSRNIGRLAWSGLMSLLVVYAINVTRGATMPDLAAGIIGGVVGVLSMASSGYLKER